MIKLINLLEMSSSEFRAKIKTLGHSEQGSELTSGGELNPKLLDILSLFLDEWTKIGGNGCKLQFTSGNDKFHQNRNSKHKIGDAVDVTLSTSCHTKFTELLNSYVKKYPGFVFINEYRNPSQGSSGGHFHINIASNSVVNTNNSSSVVNTDNNSSVEDNSEATEFATKFLEKAVGKMLGTESLNRFKELLK
jgi:hypothetical protein